MRKMETTMNHKKQLAKQKRKRDWDRHIEIGYFCCTMCIPMVIVRRRRNELELEFCISCTKEDLVDIFDAKTSKCTFCCETVTEDSIIQVGSQKFVNKITISKLKKEYETIDNDYKHMPKHSIFGLSYDPHFRSCSCCCRFQYNIWFHRCAGTYTCVCVDDRCIRIFFCFRSLFPSLDIFS